MKPHRVTFPSTHAFGGQPFTAEASAPTPALATREVLEHCAREGIVLEYLSISDIQDLKGAHLDGLKLSNCKVRNVDFSGASLKGARIEHTRLFKSFADQGTKLDGASLENVHFDESTIDGLSMKSATCSALRFEFSSARDLDVKDTVFHGLRQIRSDLSGWHMHMASLTFFEDAEGVISKSALSANEKAAVRTFAATGNREAAEHYLARLNAQTSNA